MSLLIAFFNERKRIIFCLWHPLKVTCIANIKLWLVIFITMPTEYYSWVLISAHWVFNGYFVFVQNWHWAIWILFMNSDVRVTSLFIGNWIHIMAYSDVETKIFGKDSLRKEIVSKERKVVLEIYGHVYKQICIVFFRKFILSLSSQNLLFWSLIHTWFMLFCIVCMF